MTAGGCQADQSDEVTSMGLQGCWHTSKTPPCPSLHKEAAYKRLGHGLLAY